MHTMALIYQINVHQNCFLYYLTLKICEAAFSYDMRYHAHGHVFAVNAEDLSRKTFRQERNKKNVLSF